MCLRFAGLKCHAECLWSAERGEGAAARHPVLGSCCPSQLTRTHGHKAGDRVLSQVAAVLKATARQGDLVCRLGGEEFVVIAPGHRQRRRSATGRAHASGVFPR
ncbi:diguanylate cyclase domain-containing protein [Pseudomonas sp. 8O]|uniref:diguanylate cyclase domain-containing protein n=1 Tax=Pseudomonas sp. 8O TaxID=2653165 RepID=UPI002114EC93|nr:diguanylate cyclase [Pseudomonas sp. 8O]